MGRMILRRSWPIFFRVSVVILVLMLALTVYLDLQIVKKFEGQKWALPAHVYTRPMELYVGLQIKKSELLDELVELGYSQQSRAPRVGTYDVSATIITVYQREFQFWDGLRPAQRVELTYAQQGDLLRITAMQLISDAGPAISPSIVRLESRLFGSVSPLSHEDRALVELKDVPTELVQGLIAVEDQHFYSHFGVNPAGIARAMVANLRAGRIVQGGSTLTQQLVKNYYLTLEQTYTRKVTEMIMAVLLELHYSKEEILQTYINEVNLAQAGNRAIHGFGLASRHFYGQPLSELGIDQLAMLIGINNGPSYYNPIRHPERALKRRDLVLQTMLRETVISQEQFDQAVAMPLRLNPSAASAAKFSYPAFMGLVRDNLQASYAQSDLLSSGLKIYTTLDPRVQANLEQAAAAEVIAIERRYGIKSDTLQVAAVVVRTDNGEVAGMIGDRSAKFSGYNRALQAKRPVGSLLKPFVFLTALEMPEKYSLASPISDRAITVSQVGSPDWQPQNYDGQEHGDVLLIDALAKSYNLATVNLGMELGVDQVANTIRRMGYTQSVSELPSLLLGAVPMSVMDVAQLYLTLAADGFKTPIKGVRSVLDQAGAGIERYPLNIEQVVEPEFTALINYALQEVVRSGTGQTVLSGFRYDYGLAGKTGTTDGYRDSWFAGFSGNYLTVVWVGRDDNQPTGLTGASGAARVWGEIMRKIPQQRLELGMHDTIFPTQVRVSMDADQHDCLRVRQLPIHEESLPLRGTLCSEDLRYDPEVNIEPTEPIDEERKPKSLWDLIFGG